MTAVHLADVKPLPWRNGGGFSRDLLAWPSRRDWQLRISVAEVARSGPFSAYPGVDRWFAVAQGAGVVLHFDGAAAPACDLVDGTTLDLNLMARQSARRAEMIRAEPAASWADTAPLRAVFTWHEAALRIDGGPALALPACTLAYTTRACGERWRLHGQVPRAWWMAFEPAEA